MLNKYNLLFKMGQQQNIELRDLKTQEQVTKFINDINNDTARLEQKGNTILGEINKRELNPQLTKVADAYFRAECECNAPPFVFWLSPHKREKCQNAKLEAFNQFSKLCVSQLEK